jgi:hypothetical protein
MSLVLKIALAIVALTASAGTVYYNGTLSPDNWVYQGGGKWKDGGYHQPQVRSPAPASRFLRLALVSIG